MSIGIKCIITVLATIALFSTSNVLRAADFHARDYGVVGDGITDDGPAIQTALLALYEQPGAHSLIFESSKQFYIQNIQGSYLFNMEGRSGITIEGRNQASPKNIQFDQEISTYFPRI